MSPESSRCFSHKGLTLVELLVCIAIIGLLASVVFSVVPSMLANMRATRCLTNMRAAGSGFLLYASDNANTLPTQKTDNLALINEAGWVGQVAPYLDTYKVLLCTESNPAQQYPNVSYGYNSFASTFSNPNRKPVDMSESETPERDILLMDTSLSGSTKNAFIMTNVNAGAAHLHPHRHGSNRNGARSVLFVDGHVEMVPVGALSWRQLQWPD